MAVADPEDAEEAVVELDSDSDAAGGTEDETPNDVAGTDDDVPTVEARITSEEPRRKAPRQSAPTLSPCRRHPRTTIGCARSQKPNGWSKLSESNASAKRRWNGKKRSRPRRPKGRCTRNDARLGIRRHRCPVREDREEGANGKSSEPNGRRGEAASGMTPTSGGDGGGGGASPFAAFSFAPPPASTPVRTEDTPVQAASPFNGGFSLLSTPAAEIRDAGADVKPGGGGGIMSRLSGAPKPFVEPEPEPEPEEEEEEEEEPKAAPFSFQAAPAPAPVAPPKSAPAPTPVPKSTTSAPGRTALAVELDL